MTFVAPPTASTLFLLFSVALLAGAKDSYVSQYCLGVLGGLKHEHKSKLRDHFQLAQTAQRHVGELEPQLSNKLKPPKKEEERHTYFNPASADDIRALIQRKTQWADGNMTAVRALMQEYVAQGLLNRSTTERELTSCLVARLNRALYPNAVQVSFLLNYFRRPWVIDNIPRRLMASCGNASVACELVVNVDSPGEAGAWADAVRNTSGFVVPVFSNNLHEARGYNRAARVARGKIVVILQDDYYPPENGDWVRNLLAIFHAYPRMGAVGLNTYRFCVSRDNNRWNGDNPFTDPVLGFKWHFAHVADFAPLAVRKATWESAGGLDETASEPGECGITSDWEFCHRVWMDGWQVGFMASQGANNDGHESGTHTSEAAEKCWGRQMAVGNSIYGARWNVDAVQQELCENVRLLNNKHLKLTGECPVHAFNGPCANNTGASL